jgi:16S rRNA (guanine527-N7)-methyltransferase
VSAPELEGPPPQLDDPRVREAMTPILELLRAERSSVSSIIEPQRAWQVHVADSLSGLVIPALAEATEIADVGSGAGFPGLPLAAALPDARIDLIESVGRKADFIERAVAIGQLANTHVIADRAETWALQAPPAGGRESYDAVTARAVGRLSTLAELASPLLKRGGTLIAWKGRRDTEEEEELGRASERLAMKPLEILEVGPFAGSRHRHLHVVEKSAPTPEGLPRRTGVAKKRPFGARRGPG